MLFVHQVVGYDGVLACPKEGVLCVMLPDIPVPTPAPSLRPAANPSLPLVPTGKFLHVFYKFHLSFATVTDILLAFFSIKPN